MKTTRSVRRSLMMPACGLLLAGLLTLAGCGGGTAENSDGSTPPAGGSAGAGAGASTQTLANTPEQARSLVQASMSTDASVVATDKRFDKLNQNGLTTVTANGGPAPHWPRERPASRSPRRPPRPRRPSPATRSTRSARRSGRTIP
ncbi:MAG: hypothetical protein R3E68_19445 [Burkholderiaceae bacterium]